MMPVEDYDLAGFAVGIVDKKKILDNTRMAEGDVVIALPSTGIHSNGFSLCRKVFDIDNNNPELYIPREELGGKTIAESLLTPTRIYVKAVLALLEQVEVKGISHITGGGFYENIPRAIPDGLCAVIDKSAIRVLPIFDMIASWGSIPERDMYNTYNMGVGMSVVVPADQAEKAVDVPAGALRLQLSVHTHRAFLRGAANGKLHAHGGKSENRQEEKIDHDKSAAAVLSAQIWKSPDVTDSDRASRADQNKAEAAPQCFPLRLC
jgi:hypothetical protein